MGGGWGGSEEERWEIIASFPNLGDNIPCFISARSACECVRQLPEDSHAMATASGGRARLFVKGGGKASPLPFFSSSPSPRQTCGEAAELSRGHTTHIASAPIHPMRRLKIAHPHPHPPPPPLLPPPPLALLRLHVNFSPGCHLPTQSSISLSVCLAGRINGLSLEQVLIPLQCYKAVEPPDWNPLFASASRVSLTPCFCTFCTTVHLGPDRRLRNLRHS